MGEETILEVRNLTKYYPIHTGFFLKHTGDVKALDGVSFSVKKGRSIGIVGESGCGKSTLGKSIIRLHPSNSGTVYFNNIDFFSLSGEKLRKARQDIQMIFQDPFASLDPRMSISRIIKEPLNVNKIGTNKEKGDRIKELLHMVGLDLKSLNRYPHEFSGGQRQRVSIARCLATNPKLIIADEPVSALDVSVQAQILNLLLDLREKLGLTFVFVSHDLSVIDYVCEDVAVMYLGNIVEMAPKEALFNNPQHPYTKALIDTIPKVGEGKKLKRNHLKGEIASPINPPSGCKFHQRCGYCLDKCRIENPPLLKNGDHSVSCWLIEH